MVTNPLINSIVNLHDFSDKDIQLISLFFKNVNFTKGTILEKANTVCQKLYFIKNGFIRTFSNKEHIEITTQIIGKNRLITGFNSFVTGELSKENIQCISNCQALYITKADYNALTKESVAWRAFCKQVYEKSISFSLQRTTDLLSLSAKERYLKLVTEQPEIIQNVPVQYIASYIGIKPESLSRIRKQIIS